jgi:hypothetical protein
MVNDAVLVEQGCESIGDGGPLQAGKIWVVRVQPNGYLTVSIAEDDGPLVVSAPATHSGARTE